MRVAGSLLLLATAACPIPAGEPTGPDPAGLAASVFLGQAYPSGAVYVEGFRSVDGDLLSGELPDSLRVLHLDELEGGGAGHPPGSAPTWARLVRSLDEPANPPAVEGMLAEDSPCAPAGYEARAGRDYAPVPRPGAPPAGWNEADFFATIEWYGCAADPALALYELDRPPARSFRVLALAPGLGEVAVDRSFAGTPRAPTPSERDELERRGGAHDPCTLEPRTIESAHEILRLRLDGAPNPLRLARHIEACTALAEVFTLDLLDTAGGVETSFRLVRWRGNP